MESEDTKIFKHHKQQEYCLTRPLYRQGRRLTAVKVYTINNESQHLCIYGVPSIGLRKELKNLLTKYGEVLNLSLVPDVETEIFTECFHAHFKRIQSARVAKRILDTRSFYGGLLHICYAPELETVGETKAKLLQRKKDVLNRLQNNR
ncbi:RNA-binding protein 48 [Sitophilus oryzae]|uniref:RNA-binding protein 48 n=1 Tax=Sitophilus oryzae TaxID=7048 RepID=A0A6J2X5H1_SITOR|nr:RNA-binding protein 48 [Sitophilus oryzae]